MNRPVSTSLREPLLKPNFPNARDAMFRQSVLAAIAALIGGFASYSYAAVSYNADSTIGNDGNFSRAVPGFMQVITLSTPDVPQVIDSFSLMGVRYNADIPADSAAMSIVFYSDVDESPGSTDALMHANFLGQATFALPEGTFGSFFLSDLPINVMIPGNKVGVAVYMTNADGTDYNFNVAGRLTTGVPSVGSNDGFIYLDQNTDAIFSGDERFREIGINAQDEVPTNLRVVISSVVPEPSSLTALALAGLILSKRRAIR